MDALALYCRFHIRELRQLSIRSDCLYAGNCFLLTIAYIMGINKYGNRAIGRNRPFIINRLT